MPSTLEESLKILWTSYFLVVVQTAQYTPERKVITTTKFSRPTLSFLKGAKPHTFSQTPRCNVCTAKLLASLAVS